VTFTFKNGDLLTDEIDVPNAHRRGATPYGREDYIRKFLKLSDGVVSKAAADRFLNLVHRLPDLSVADVRQLHLEADQGSYVSLVTQQYSDRAVRGVLDICEPWQADWPPAAITNDVPPAMLTGSWSCTACSRTGVR
jgi:hypothetical protein